MSGSDAINDLSRLVASREFSTVLADPPLALTTGMGKLLYRLEAGRKADVLYLPSASHQDVLNVDNISKAGRQR